MIFILSKSILLNFVTTLAIESQLPQIPLIDDIKNGSYVTYNSENIDEIIKHLTNAYLNQVIM